MRGRRVALWLLGSAVALSLGACTPLYRDHGYVPTDADLSAIEIGRSTHEDVAQKIGRPSATGLLNDNEWIYVQSRWRTYGAYAPEEIDRQVVVVSFADTGAAKNVERFGLDNGNVVALSRRVTTSSVPDVGLLKRIFGNLGRVSAEDIMR